MLTKKTGLINIMPSSNKYAPYTPLNFENIDKQANKLADLIELRLEKLTDILLRYESFEVVQDEVGRTLDLLRNLKENKKYFRLRVGEITSFLPRNQPLYAFSCFVVVPSLMASTVHFRIPHSTRHFFPEILDLLEIKKLFPNIIVSSKQRIEFLKERSAMFFDPKTNQSKLLTDVVIFTGTPSHADQLRKVFDKRTLFISNGAGHNPVIVSKEAKISNAVEAVVTLQFYNQGQDCGAPNTILVHKKILAKFLKMLRIKVEETRVGHYKNRSCRIGPISKPEDLARIQDFLVEHREYLDKSTPGIIRANDAVVMPTIICKPLKEGGNFREIFAPIIFVQEYRDDKELSLYFEDKRYFSNAMYITLYGNSKYIQKLIGRKIKDKILHKKSTFIHNTHLHAPGVERGTQPYGGYGYGASSISINNKITPMPTLPQRDIYDWVVKLMLRKGSGNFKKMSPRARKITERDVEKLLRLKPSKSLDQTPDNVLDGIVFLDPRKIKNGDRFMRIEEANIYKLSKEPDLEFIASLSPEDIQMIHSLKTLLRHKSTLTLEKFTASLYAIPKLDSLSETENKNRQLRFFQNIYRLLLDKDFGPRLGTFLWDLDKKDTDRLLRIRTRI